MSEAGSFRRLGSLSGMGNPRSLGAGPGRALISRASIFDLQHGQTSSGFDLAWPQGW